MTAAAMNENLGNIVLVKNRHKAQQGMQSPAGPGDDFQQPLVMDQQAAAVAGYPSSTARTSTTTTTPTTTNIQPDAQQQAVQQFYQRQDVAFGSPAPPPQVSMVPLADTTTTTTTTPASGPYGTLYGTTAATTTVPSTTGPTPTTTAPTSATSAPTTGSTMARPTVERTDELTKKETTEEKPVCDRAQKWKTYVEKTLEGGVETMLAEFRLIRGHIPPFCTRMGFDANVEKNRFEDVVCMDQTRVRLHCNSYIHASWVSITANRKTSSGCKILTLASENSSGSLLTGIGQCMKYTHPHVYMSLSGCGRAGTYAAFEKFSTVLPPKTVQKYEEFSARFNRCAELQEDLL
ncbi:Protein-tyrosine phosphatase [Ancylostoma caninum]|uniref:Protein-tyrosine phosphatase n=1 Tax=Ancylostoma caninum TaxID=29170 RepID=A0A368GJZ4_ANCCA|nr:Protein-tyrosine phosphatase [Ancylostoma caninum]